MTLSSNLQNANGPASASTLPDRGSTTSQQEKAMNTNTNTTTEIKKPVRPTDHAIVEALFEVDCDLTDLRNAAMVLDEYLNFEFRAGRGGPGP